MSDPNDSQTPAQGDPGQLGDGGKKALDAERDARRAAERKASDLETQIANLTREHETALTAVQQELTAAQQAATETVTRAEQAENTSLRYRVALETGVPAKHIGRLQGDTEEALREDAAAFVADIVPGPTTPKPDLSQGAKGDTAKPSTAQQFADAVGDF
ncbi:hypothetical protein PTW37_06540 [Arthrobacter agilis]|uniref:hypothetical protein n=1 Tax=Arthrobacter agilis TaxID=37921 RepID=UPI0023671A14|nr:hypothetical protein [Arthrobacter agilis]WDF34552.1 hypothetical protein PTW37_06540 [Arthrobacter agilis]